MPEADGCLMARESGLRRVQRLAALMRRDQPSSVASARRWMRLVGETPPSYSTIRRHRELFVRDDRGRYQVVAVDYTVRHMDVVTVERGVQRDLAVRSSSDASKIGRWNSGLADFLQTGDESQLAELTERDVTIRSGRAHLETDPDRLQRLADSGELDDFMRNYHQGRRR